MSVNVSSFKIPLILLALIPSMEVDALDVNKKFGKPTDEEMSMTVYEADKDAPAVVLCQLTNVGYTMDFYNYFVDYEVKTRIKVLKDEGKEYGTAINLLNQLEATLPAVVEAIDAEKATIMESVTIAQ